METRNKKSSAISLISNIRPRNRGNIKAIVYTMDLEIPELVSGWYYTWYISISSISIGLGVKTCGEAAWYWYRHRWYEWWRLDSLERVCLARTIFKSSNTCRTLLEQFNTGEWPASKVSCIIEEKLDICGVHCSLKSSSYNSPVEYLRILNKCSNLMRQVMVDCPWALERR